MKHSGDRSEFGPQLTPALRTEPFEELGLRVLPNRHGLIELRSPLVCQAGELCTASIGIKQFDVAFPDQRLKIPRKRRRVHCHFVGELADAGGILNRDHLQDRDLGRSQPCGRECRIEQLCHDPRRSPQVVAGTILHGRQTRLLESRTVGCFPLLASWERYGRK